MNISYSKLRQYSKEKVTYLMAYGYQKLGFVLDKRYTQALSKIVNSAVDLTNDWVDYYLPASEEELEESENTQDETSEQEETDPNTIGNVAKKVGALSIKMRRRVMSQNVSKIVNSALELTHRTVDYYLPPLEEEVKEGQQKQDNSEETKAVQLSIFSNVVKQVGVLSTKMRRRVFAKVKVFWIKC